MFRSERKQESDWQRVIPALPLGYCVTLNKLLNLSMPQFILLENGDDNVPSSWGYYEA